MRTALEHALEFAAQGCSVFPVQKSKYPFKGFHWRDLSTTDTAQIQEWAKQYPGCNWAMDCFKSDRTVYDVDVKDGAAGLDSHTILLLEYDDMPDTLKIETPSGGFHLHFTGRIKSLNAFRPGIDVKSDGGYVLIPGSTNEQGTPYRVVEDRVPARVPEWLRAEVGAPKERTENAAEVAPGVELDNSYAVEKAILYLQEQAGLTAHGSRDNDTYQVVCKVKDMGVSEDRCVELMTRHWLPRHDNSLGDWTHANIAQKARSAYSGNASNQVGADQPQAVFANVVVPAAPAFKLYQDIEELPDINAEWLVEDYIPRDGLTLIFGESGSLKSFTALDIAYHVAAGKEWHGRTVEQGITVYICGEGQAGIKKRGQAWKKHHEATVPLPIYYHLLPVEFSVGEEVQRFGDLLRQLDKPPAMVIVDTLSQNFGPGNENATEDMKAFIAGVNSVMNHKRARIVVHHTGHSNKDRERGAYALRAALDASFQVKRVQSQEGRFGCTMRCVKMRDAGFPAELGFTAKIVTVGWKDDGAPSTSLALENCEIDEMAAKHEPITGQQQAALDIVQGHQQEHGEGMSLDKLAAALVDGEHYRRKDTAKTGIVRLVKRNLISLKNGVVEIGFR